MLYQGTALKTDDGVTFYVTSDEHLGGGVEPIEDDTLLHTDTGKTFIVGDQGESYVLIEDGAAPGMGFALQLAEVEDEAHSSRPRSK